MVYRRDLTFDHNIWPPPRELRESQNGDTKWTFTTDDEIHSSPAIGPDGTIYIGSRKGTLYAVDPQGRQKWTSGLGETYDAVTIGRDGTIYVGAEYALTPEGTVKWQSRIGFNRSSSAIGKDGTLYAGIWDIVSYSVVALTVRTVSVVSAASFLGAELAPESIVTAFGVDLATGTEIASRLPLPTELAGTTVDVTDSTGWTLSAPLFFVSPTQVNYQIPPRTSTGAATVNVKSGDGKTAAGTIQVVNVAPGLFTANANGQGVAAGWALRVKANGTQSFEPIARYDQAQNRYVTAPIDLGPESDQVFLVLFGTGFRFRSALSSVIARVGGENSQVSYVGPQGDFIGLDQLNARLSRSLIGRGEVDLTLVVDGKQANTARVNVK